MEAPKQAKQPSAAKNDYLQRKQAASELRKAKTAFLRCEQEIADTEEQLEQGNLQLSSDVVAADYEKVAELSEQADKLNKKLEELMLEWERLGQLLEG